MNSIDKKKIQIFQVEKLIERFLKNSEVNPSIIQNNLRTKRIKKKKVYENPVNIPAAYHTEGKKIHSKSSIKIK